MTKSMQLPVHPPTQQQQQQDMDVLHNTNCTAAATSSKKKKKHKKKSKGTSNSKSVADFAAKTQADMVDAMMNHHVIRHGDHNDMHHKHISKSSSNNKNGKMKEEDNFWSSTNNTEERQKIREFWLQLGEDERRSLVKVEKEAVLRKMKEQQKHSCNCSVCGKKRTAIEDELEVLYDAYYEELEQYANHQQQTRGSVNPLHAGYLPTEVIYDPNNESTDHYDDDDDDDEDEDEDDEDDDLDEDDEEDDEDDLDDDDDDEDDEDDDDDEEDEDDEEEDDFDDADDEDEIITRPPIATYAERSRYEEMTHIRHTPLSRASPNGDHFSFGNSLTVKGGILTVADDLLKNDGKKFLDMMERLAERRMQKEDITIDQSNSYFQDEEEDDDNFEDDEDDDTRTEEQRMEEGRRMFQIFAARMFEQRVLAAYREKVAQERQQRLLEELEEEERLREEKEAKKLLEREKKKDKKRQMKQQQEEERLAREAKKKAEEEAVKREKEKKLASERQKREQERLQREEEKKQREEERLKKEEEKKRRIKEEKERAAEKERKRKEKEEKDRIAAAAAATAAAAAAAAEKEKLQKLKEANDKKHTEKKTSPVVVAQKVITSPPGIPTRETLTANDPENNNRQQVLIEALVGPRPSFIETPNKSPMRPPPPQQQPFMPSHLNILQNGPPTSSLLSNTFPLDHTSSSLPDPSMMGLFHHRVGSPLESSTSTRQSRSIAPIAPIGQPLNGRRVSSVPLTTNSTNSTATTATTTNSTATTATTTTVTTAATPAPVGSTLQDMQTPFMDPFSKRPSVHSPFDTEAGPRSFFSSFLFGEPTRTNPPPMMMPPPPEYDMRFAQQQQQPDRRFSTEMSSNHWTNGWTASSVLSDNVHGKLFGGDALPDRTMITLERVKIAYQKLNEITQTRIFRGPTSQYHTLVQLHCMMNDLYCDFQVDIRELYEVLIGSPLSGFQCLNHAQHGMVVLYEPIVVGGLGNPSLSSQPLSTTSSLHNMQQQHHHSPPHNNPFSSSNHPPSLPPPHPLQGNNPTLFGSMS